MSNYSTDTDSCEVISSVDYLSKLNSEFFNRDHKNTKTFLEFSSRINHKSFNKDNMTAFISNFLNHLTEKDQENNTNSNLSKFKKNFIKLLFKESLEIKYEIERDQLLKCIPGKKPNSNISKSCLLNIPQGTIH